MEAIVQFLKSIASTDLFLLMISVVAYFAAQTLYKRHKSIFLTPIIISSGAVIIILKLADVDFETYHRANGMLNFMLGFSVVCLGYLLHTNIKHIKSLKFSILTTVFIGSITGVLSVMGLAALFGYDPLVALSLQPKSVTTPIALSLSENIGGIQAITALSVVVTGIFGSVVGPRILRLIRVTDPVARGLAMGSAAHAVGTARALDMGALEGAVGGAAIGLMGLFTSFVLPLLNEVF